MTYYICHNRGRPIKIYDPPEESIVKVPQIGKMVRCQFCTGGELHILKKEKK